MEQLIAEQQEKLQKTSTERLKTLAVRAGSLVKKPQRPLWQTATANRDNVRMRLLK